MKKFALLALGLLLAAQISLQGQILTFVFEEDALSFVDTPASRPVDDESIALILQRTETPEAIFVYLDEETTVGAVRSLQETLEALTPAPMIVMSLSQKVDFSWKGFEKSHARFWKDLQGSEFIDESTSLKVRTTNENPDKWQRVNAPKGDDYANDYPPSRISTLLFTDPKSNFSSVILEVAPATTVVELYRVFEYLESSQEYYRDQKVVGIAIHLTESPLAPGKWMNPVEADLSEYTFETVPFDKEGFGPSYGGEVGQAALETFIRHIGYHSSIETKKQMRPIAPVHVDFCVSPLGEITDISIRFSLNDTFAEGARKGLMEAEPWWFPAFKDGKPVYTSFKNVSLEVQTRFTPVD